MQPENSTYTLKNNSLSDYASKQENYYDNIRVKVYLYKSHTLALDCYLPHLS